MAGRLTGRRMLVTGAASGIGLATASLFVGEGARVAFLDRDDKVKAAAARHGGLGIVCDVASETSVKDAVRKAADGLGGLDGLVNAAGITTVQKFRDTSLEVWRNVVDVNLTGPFLVCRAALTFLEQSSEATIVNIASATALLPSGAAVSYAASKAGLLVMTKALAAEIAPRVRVNAVCPGAIDTPMVAYVKQSDPEMFRKLEATYALKRIGQPEEIAKAILFLSCEARRS